MSPFSLVKKIFNSTSLHLSSDGGDIKRRLQQMDFLFGSESMAETKQEQILQFTGVKKKRIPQSIRDMVQKNKYLRK